MSYMSKVEMSYSLDATLSLSRRRQDGGKGHYRDEPEGAETITRDP
jgi:hypothetical protein